MKLLILIGLIMGTAANRLFSQDEQSQRHNMVRQQLEARGINHRATLEAMRKVQRHLFVPARLRAHAYTDSPLSIGQGQTISQPYIVAYMTQLLDLKPHHRVLEIGTGSGYQAAVLAEMVEQVFTIEIVKELGQRAEKLLDSLGYDNVSVVIGDGYQGLEAEAPFDAIIVTAAPDKIPPPLVEQLKDGGKMVIPVGPPAAIQTLVLMEKREGKIVEPTLTPVRFVPFTRSQ